MPEQKNNTFYVTTPIYYVNAKPHLGSLYSTLLADVLARWHKLKGQDVFMLTGTDEHGQKIAESAFKVGKEPKLFVDSFIEPFKDTWHAYGIDYSHFIRTTDAAHVKGVQTWLTDLMAKGDIYKATYSGWYCTPCETYLTDKDLANVGTGGIPLCPSCGRLTGQLSEECYFFKMSAYQERLLEFYRANPDFITPAERLNEVVAFVESGLKDLCLSRTTITWGIPFPGDEKHVTYVWADALNNYITAIGYADPHRQEEFKKWWPCDVHVLGKDIVRFHAVFWPAFLMATDLELPKKLLVHGWIKVGEQKMSKSLGNAVDPVELLRTYGQDPVRYYLVRHMAVTQDSPFSTEDLELRITTDLANDLGNLVHRLTTLAHKYNQQTLTAPHVWQQPELALRDELWDTLETMQREMENCYMHRAYAALWKYVQQVNAYLHAQEPWKVVKNSPERFVEILSAATHALAAIAYLAWPVMPHKMSDLLQQLGVSFEKDKNILEYLAINPWTHTFTLSLGAPLFTKYPQEETEQKGQEASSQQTTSGTQQAPEHVLATFDDLMKIELRVGTIIEVNEVPKSDKLYSLRLDFGPLGIRHICSGIKKYFTPADLLNKQVVVAYNLAPRKMMGLESQGMIFTAEDESGEKVVLVRPEQSVPNGARLK